MGSEMCIRDRPSPVAKTSTFKTKVANARPCVRSQLGLDVRRLDAANGLRLDLLRRRRRRAARGVGVLQRPTGQQTAQVATVPSRGPTLSTDANSDVVSEKSASPLTYTPQ